MRRKSDKTFLKLSESEQSKEMKSRFYEKVKCIEREKLFYFGLVYNQETGIITAPGETKEQKKGRGEEGRKRKGKEEGREKKEEREKEGR